MIDNRLLNRVESVIFLRIVLINQKKNVNMNSGLKRLCAVISFLDKYNYVTCS
mgnify:CR=1